MLCHCSCPFCFCHPDFALVPLERCEGLVLLRESQFLTSSTSVPEGGEGKTESQISGTSESLCASSGKE